MSGETEKQVSAWQVDTLKEYLQAIIDGNDRRYTEKFNAQEDARKYAQEKSNEFRGSLDDIGKRQMPRTEAEAIFKSLLERSEAAATANSDKIDALQARMDRNEGRSGGFSSGWGYLVGAIGLIVMLVTIVIALRR